MRQLICIVCLLLFNICLIGQNKSSVITKVTATWCPNCGTWGWDYFEELKDVYANSSQTTLLGVHHSGDLRNSVSSWYANNLNFTYQPQFYHNNFPLNVSRNNWEDKVEEAEELVDQFSAETSGVSFSFEKAYVDNGDIVCNVNFNASNKSLVDNYFAIYVFENNVMNNQSSRGMSLHPNVLRDVMSDNNQGDLFTGEDENGASVFSKEYRMTLDNSWDADNVGLLAVLWTEENGNYVLDNSSSIYNIGLLSSSSEVIASDLVKIAYVSNGFEIITEFDGQTKFMLYNSNAQLLQSGLFEYSTTIETQNQAPGIYSILLSNGNKVYTQQVVITQ